MEKRPAGKAAGPPGKKGKPADAETLINSPDPSDAGSQFASTEEFTMPEAEDDAAADFLLDREENDTPAPEKPPPKRPAKPLARTEGMPLARTESMPDVPAAPKAPPKPAKAPAAAAAPAGQKGTVLGDYRLLKKLGQGGMGAVYRAHQISLDREVAVKVLSKELAGKTAFVERFKREARVMAKLDHPNILRCFEVNEALGYHYLSMEFVEGGSVEGWLEKLGKFSLGDALHIAVTVAHALHHAHELTLVHRDIKPDNILLTKKGVVKVADLGLAKAQDDNMGLTKTGTGAGTPIYMAPEQARDVKHVDGRVDIYALGCMLYVFLTGKPPFAGETLVELIGNKEKGKFTPVRQLNDEVPERLSLIIDKMIATKPEHRYQSCAEVILDLDGLGLAHAQLSFFAETPAPKAAAPPPKKINVSRAAAAAAASTPASAPAADEGEDNVWYANLTDADGSPITRKLTTAQVIGLVRHGSADADTPLSKTRTGGYRSLGTYPEFVHLTKAKQTKEKAERKAEKFKAMYQKIDKEEKSRLRWRWIHNLFLKTGGFVGLLLWLAVIGLLLVGGYFLVSWGLELLKDRFG